MSSGSVVGVVVLSIVYALAFSATPMMMLVGSLLGADLAPSDSLATLPIAVMIVGTALGVYPTTLIMVRYGRRNGLWLFIAVGALACVAAAQSLVLQSFSLFCISAAFIGVANAAIQQIRFAAMECVSDVRASTAASVVLCSGVIAAFLGPELAVIGRHLTGVAYQGSFYLLALCTALAAPVLLLYVPANIATPTSARSTRPLNAIIVNPTFCLALGSGIIGYAIMTFVMTGTPISMHNHHGHSLLDTKWVVQSHIAAMYLPSLVAPWLFSVIGIRGVMLTGLACYAITIVVGHVDTSVMAFWIQLVALGIGWNFLFVAGTSLLPRTYRSGEGFKVQSLNDGIVFSVQALASLTAGWAINSTSWQIYLLVCIFPIALMVAIMLWSNTSYKRQC